jgi:hypothetical protein
VRGVTAWARPLGLGGVVVEDVWFGSKDEVIVVSLSGTHDLNLRP